MKNLLLISSQRKWFKSRSRLELNEFKKNILFDSNSFGLLSLNKYFDDKLESQILNLKQTVDLIKTCEFSQNEKFTLLY